MAIGQGGCMAVTIKWQGTLLLSCGWGKVLTGQAPGKLFWKLSIAREKSMGNMQ